MATKKVICITTSDSIGWLVELRSEGIVLTSDLNKATRLAYHQLKEYFWLINQYDPIANQICSHVTLTERQAYKLQEA